jgi:hypothetical protein
LPQKAQTSKIQEAQPLLRLGLFFFMDNDHDVGKHCRNASRVHNHHRYAQREMLYRHDRGLCFAGSFDLSTRSSEMISSAGGGIGASTGSTVMWTSEIVSVMVSTGTLIDASITSIDAGSITGSTTGRRA